MLNPKPSTSPWAAARASEIRPRNQPRPLPSRASRLRPSPSWKARRPSRSRSACPRGCGDSVGCRGADHEAVISSAGCRSGGPGGKAITPSQREADARTARRARTPSGSFTSHRMVCRAGKTRRCERPEGAGRTQSQKRSCRVGFLLPCSTGEPAGVRPLGTPSLRRHGYRRAQANVAR